MQQNVPKGFAQKAKEVNASVRPKQGKTGRNNLLTLEMSRGSEENLVCIVQALALQRE